LPFSGDAGVAMYILFLNHYSYLNMNYVTLFPENQLLEMEKF